MKIIILAVAAALIAGAASADELVANGGFETGSFSSWTQFGNTGFTGVDEVFGGVPPSEGAFQAFFGPVGSTGGIVQTLATTDGGSYRLTFDLASFVGGNFFSASWGGVALLTLNSSVDAPYQSYSFDVSASGATTDLAFTTQHDPSYWLLDNVSVSGAVPEPATWAMMLTGFFGAGAFLRRRRMVAA